MFIAGLGQWDEDETDYLDYRTPPFYPTLPVSRPTMNWLPLALIAAGGMLLFAFTRR